MPLTTSGEKCADFDSNLNPKVLDHLDNQANGARENVLESMEDFKKSIEKYINENKKIRTVKSFSVMSDSKITDRLPNFRFPDCFSLK